jgi:hypothetical protein
MGTGIGALLIAVLAAGAPASADDLPAPFQRFSHQDLLALLHLDEAAPVVRETRLWKGEGASRLIALIENGSGRYVLAQFALDGDRIVLNARHGRGPWDDAWARPGPLSADARRTAIGVKFQRMVTGGTAVVLVLYLRSGRTFEPVFTRIVRSSAMDSDDESSAVIQVVPGKQEYSDLRVIETGTGATVRELWTWDGAAKAYRHAQN